MVLIINIVGSLSCHADMFVVEFTNGDLSDCEIFVGADDDARASMSVPLF